jgi:hypothetical protein
LNFGEKNVSTEAILDTGCTITMISKKIFDLLPESGKLTGKQINLTGANGLNVGHAYELKSLLKIVNSYGTCLLKCYYLQNLFQDMFLGFTWFRAINPRIEWNDVEPEVVNLLTIENRISSDENLFMTPTAEDSLPPHRQFNLRIKLLPSSKIPLRPIFPLCQKDSECLREYLSKALAAGHMVPSKSPAEAPIFFVKKKDGRLRPIIDYRH